MKHNRLEPSKRNIFSRRIDADCVDQFLSKVGSGRFHLLHRGWLRSVWNPFSVFNGWWFDGGRGQTLPLDGLPSSRDPRPHIPLPCLTQSNSFFSFPSRGIRKATTWFFWSLFHSTAVETYTQCTSRGYLVFFRNWKTSGLPVFENNS
jgi:hypothetical protein